MREFSRYVALNVLGMLGISCYILADTFFVANALGADGLAALNLAIPVYNFIHGAGLLLGIGGAARFALLRGRGAAGGNEVFTHALVLGAAVSAFGMAAGAFGAEAMAAWMGAEGEVAAMTVTYLRMILLFTPLFVCNQIVLAFARNDGAPRRVMVAMVTGSLANIVLDYLLMYPLGMGILGAVLATGIAPVISLAVLSPHFPGKGGSFRPVGCRLSGDTCRRIAVGGAYAFVTEGSCGVVMMVCNALALGLAGTVGVAAYGVVANIALVVTAIANGIAQGMQPLVSRSVGRGDGQERRLLVWGLGTALAVNGLIYACMVLGAQPVAAAFNGSGDSVLQSLAQQGLRLYFLGCVPAAVTIVASAWLSAVGRGAASGVLSLLRGFLVVLPLLVVLAHLGGVTGLWLAVPVTEVLVCVAACLLTGRGGRWYDRGRKDCEAP